MSKPSNEDLLATLRVLDGLGMDSGWARDKIIENLPASMRPPRSFMSTVEVRVNGAAEACVIDDSALDRLDKAIMAAWQPVTVKVGKKTYEVKVVNAYFKCL